LAQLLRKALLRWVKAKEEYNTLEIVKVKIRCEVDVLYRLERKIIEMLLLYDKTEEFEDVL
jgi:DNA primase